jgi:excinuclease ABC subunit A
MDKVKIVGAREHNLKNITVEIPRNKLTVVTGISGSGKSTLAFDTIYAEGQRRYVESLSSYARQFLGNLGKPDVDYIEGLSPSISIDQKTAGMTPRSTVGTMSEIYDYLRLLFARVGVFHCPKCKTILEKQEVKSKKSKPGNGKKKYIQKVYYCQKCDITFPEITMSSFSFNNPEGACPDCQGLGRKKEIEPELVFPNLRLTINEGAIRPWSRTTSQSNWYNKSLGVLAKKYRFSLDTPVSHLPKKTRDLVLFGDGDFEGVVPNLERRYKETDSDYVRSEIEKYMVEKTCPTCHGQRLRQEVLNVLVNGRNIVEIVSKTVEETYEYFNKLEKGLSAKNLEIAKQIIREVKNRLKFLMEVGVDYLTLDRSADTLAGGEAQRIRLATQIGSYLTGVLYILDEPSIGLHQKDQERLLKTLFRLRDLSNTVIVVEHDESTILAADHVIDMGPGAGELGGEVVAEGTPNEIKKSNSLTGQYLSGKKKINAPKKTRIADKFLVVKGAEEFNLKNIDVKFPLNTFTVVTGVSGSGKSTLVLDILARALAKKFHHAKTEPGKHKAILGTQNLDKVISIDQSPIGRTPRSNPATYAAIFTPIREIYASLPESVSRKYSSGHFSFNVKGGRCENCKGEGTIKFEMHFLPDAYVTCEVCHGRRYNQEVLDILYKGKNIADVLDMTVEEAYKFFSDVPILKHKLGVLKSVGLGYMRLGQSATTLSGGEAQRVKLATELARQDTGNTLYILDEPTSGLHFEDINRLLGVLQALVDKGNSVLVIEHNLDVVKCADYVIDMGPEGGVKGGQIIAEGTPKEISKNKYSFTGKYLKEVLEK